MYHLLTPQELILKTFKELWFNEKLSTHKTSEEGPYDIQARTRIIMDVVAAVTHHDWLIDLLVQLLNNEKDSNSKSVFTMCSQMCQSLIEFLLAAEEKRANETTPQVTIVTYI